VKTAVTHPLPTGVTAQVRSAENQNFIFLLNFNASEKVIQLDETTYCDALSGQKIDYDITLPAYGLRILKQQINAPKVFDND